MLSFGSLFGCAWLCCISGFMLHTLCWCLVFSKWNIYPHLWSSNPFYALRGRGGEWQRHLRMEGANRTNTYVQCHARLRCLSRKWQHKCASFSEVKQLSFDCWCGSRFIRQQLILPGVWELLKAAAQVFCCDFISYDGKKFDKKWRNPNWYPSHGYKLAQKTKQKSRIWAMSIQNYST